MKSINLTEKTILALFIVIFGMSTIVFLDMKDTTENSIVNLIIMVVSFYFGSSAFKEQKDNKIDVKAIIASPPPDPDSDEDIGGGGPRNPSKP